MTTFSNLSCSVGCFSCSSLQPAAKVRAFEASRVARCQSAVGSKRCCSCKRGAQPVSWSRSDPKLCCGIRFAGSYGPNQSEVTAVPLWNAPLPSPQYAGYINIPGTSKHIFYHLIVSERSPGEDPLVVRCITSICNYWWCVAFH